MRVRIASHVFTEVSEGLAGSVSALQNLPAPTAHPTAQMATSAAPTAATVLSASTRMPGTTSTTVGTNQGDTMTESTLIPQEELAALEQAAMDGDDVTPTQMAEAREKISLAGLFAKGVAMRAEEKRRKEAEEAKESAKVKVAKFLDEASTPSLESIHATARAALDKFLRQLAEHNALVASAGRILDSANVVHPNPGLVNPHDEPGFDLAFHVSQDGDRYSAVCVNGVTFPTVHTGSEFQKLIHDAANRNSLKTRGNSDLAYKIGRP